MSESVLKFCGETMTKREILLAREAYAVGAKEWSRLGVDPEKVHRDAKIRYPLPKVTMPRVVTRSVARNAEIHLALIDDRLKYEFTYDGEKMSGTVPRHDVRMELGGGNAFAVLRDFQIILDAYVDLKSSPTVQQEAEEEGR